MHGRAEVNLVPRPDLLRNDRAPDHRTPFQDEDFVARFGEVTRTDQPVVARADDNGIVLGFTHRIKCTSWYTEETKREKLA